MLSFIIDEYNGYLEMNTSTIKKAYQDENENYIVELADGTVIYPLDMELDAMEQGIKEWADTHKDEFNHILDTM